MWLHTRSPWRTFTLPWSKGCWESKNRALLTAPFCLCLWLSSCTSTWKSGTHKAQTNEHSWSDECCWPALWRLHKYSTLHTLNVVTVPQNNAQGTFPHRGVNNNYRYGWSVIQNLFSFSFFFFTKYFHVTLYRHFFSIFIWLFSTSIVEAMAHLERPVGASHLQICKNSGWRWRRKKTEVYCYVVQRRAFTCRSLSPHAPQSYSTIRTWFAFQDMGCNGNATDNMQTKNAKCLKMYWHLTAFTSRADKQSRLHFHPLLHPHVQQEQQS